MEIPAKMLTLAFGTLVIVVVLLGPVFIEAIEQNLELFSAGRSADRLHHGAIQRGDRLGGLE